MRRRVRKKLRLGEFREFGFELAFALPTASSEARLDAFAWDRTLLAGLQAGARDPATLRLSSELFSYEPYGLMLRRGDNSFQASVNRALSHLYRSGGLTQIYERWFGPFANASPLVKALYLLHSWPD